MHDYTIPAFIKDRVIRRQGRLLSHDIIEAARTALVVVDMQNYFVAEGFPLEVPVARQIVPNINRLAGALRSAGGTVVWVQTTSAGALKHWANHHNRMLTPEKSKTRLEQLDEASRGFALYDKLEPSPADLFIKKNKYRAFIQGSSDIDAREFPGIAVTPNPNYEAASQKWLIFVSTGFLAVIFLLLYWKRPQKQENSRYLFQGQPLNPG